MSKVVRAAKSITRDLTGSRFGRNKLALSDSQDDC